jgi:CDGSH-type Zn-finger protein
MVEQRYGAEHFGGSMAQVKITVRNNGPFRVEAPEGSIELVDADGNPYDLTGKTAFSLCRCGGSTNKPFCDGTHSRIGFQGAERAVAEAQKQETPSQEPPK